MSKKILIVDDEEWICSVLQDYLEESGFAVKTADSLKSARVEIQARPAPDVIVVDMSLPDGSGIGFLDEVRHNEETKKIPIILITAHTTQKIAHATEELKPNDTVLKPFNLKDLKTRIERQLAA